MEIERLSAEYNRIYEEADRLLTINLFCSGGIKIDLEKLSAEYDRIYEEADRLFREYNPCQFKDGKCAKNRRDGDTLNGCCTSCPYLKSEGCTTKALGCKLFACGYICRNFAELYGKIWELRREALETISPDVLSCCQTKERLLERMRNRGRPMSQFEVDHG